LATLVVHVGGIGDLLLTAPAIARLAEAGPVDAAGRPERLALLVHAGLVRKAYSMDSVDLASAFTGPSATLTAFVQQYDRAVVWMRDAEGACEGFRAAGVADVRAFPGLPPAGWDRHASAYYLEQLGYDAGPALRLRFSPPLPRHDVVIHPGSGGRAKNWPMGRFAEVAEMLRRAGREVTWCAGPAEEELSLPPDADVLRCETLLALARHLAGSAAYLGNDSGVSHLAAACGARCAVVFGPTDARVWAPRGVDVHVLRGDPWPSAAEAFAVLTS